MKITVPIEVEVNLTPEQRILYLKEWVYKWLKEIEHEGSDYNNSTVIVKDDKIIARGHNQKEKKNNAILHAEIVTLTKAQKKLNDWHLNDCTMYVTLEPCLMCSGAIIQTRIKRVVYGALDPKGGAIESIMKVNEIKGINHRFESISKIKEKECSTLLKTYFKSKRN